MAHFMNRFMGHFMNRFMGHFMNRFMGHFMNRFMGLVIIHVGHFRNVSSFVMTIY